VIKVGRGVAEPGPDAPDATDAEGHAIRVGRGLTEDAPAPDGGFKRIAVTEDEPGPDDAYKPSKG
jgi:hypothetical protein